MEDKLRLTYKDVSIIDKEVIYQGHSDLVKYTLNFKFFSGSWSQTVERELLEQKGAVGVLLFDPVLKKVVLIEQFRIGALEDEGSPWLLEIIAGIIGKHESIVDVARRETLEESALEILDMVPIIEYWVSPGVTTEKIALFCAKVDASSAGGIYGLTEENENIRVHVLSVSQFWDMIDNNKIRNGSAIIAALWFRLNYEKIMAKWA